MPIFFKCENLGGGRIPGRTVQLKDVGTQGMVHLVSKVEPSIGFAAQKSIITRVAVSQSGNFQFLHTLGNDVYIYVFGDRIGQITLSGLSMPSDCEGTQEQIGAELMLKWYNDYKVSNRVPPVKITIGLNTLIEGFVVNLTLDVVDPGTQLVQWNMTLATLPEK